MATKLKTVWDRVGYALVVVGIIIVLIGVVLRYRVWPWLTFGDKVIAKDKLQGWGFILQEINEHYHPSTKHGH